MEKGFEDSDLEEMETASSEINTELTDIPEFGELSEEESFIRPVAVPRVVKVVRTLYDAGCTPLLNKGRVFKNIEFKGLKEGKLILEVTRKDGSRVPVVCKDALISTGKGGRPVIVPIMFGSSDVVTRKKVRVL